MGDIVDQLPTAIEALQTLLAAARSDRDQPLSQDDRLRYLLRQLQRAQFGRRSEKPDPEQLLLALEHIEQAIAAGEAAEEKKDPAGAAERAKKRRSRSEALPAHLPHVDVTITPDDTDCRAAVRPCT